MAKADASIVFIVDTSGSMYGQKISAVNNILTEVRDIIESNTEGSEKKIVIGCGVFHQKPSKIYFLDEGDYCIQNLEVNCNEDGFYRETNFSRLYKGLKMQAEFLTSAAERTILFLITDGKSTSLTQVDDNLKQLCNDSHFKKVERYVALFDKSKKTVNLELAEFTGKNIDHIVDVLDLPQLVNRLDIFF